MYRTPYSPMHAAGPSLQMNAPLDIILIKVQSIFSSFACSGVSKGFFINLFPSIFLRNTTPAAPPLQIETGTSGVGAGAGVEVVGGCTLRLKVENVARFSYDYYGVRLSQPGRCGRGRGRNADAAV